MRRTNRTLRVLLGITLLVAACDSAERVTSSVGPQSAVLSRTVVYNGEAVIGRAGGLVTVTGERGLVLAELVVPAGAVTKDARFVVQVASDGRVAVSATSIGSRRINDVGLAGFKAPVRLYVYRSLGNGRSTVNGTSITTSSRDDGGSLFRAGGADAGGGDDGMPCDTTGGPPGPCWIWVELEGFTGYLPITD